MAMRSSRLLSILLLLGHERSPPSGLADELEVSLRTIYRDVNSLSAAGIPVYGEQGHAGGYQLLDGYRTRLTALGPSEAEALFLAGLPDTAAMLGLGQALATAPAEAAGDPLAGAARARRPDPPAVPPRPARLVSRRGPAAASRRRCRRGIWHQRRIRVRYRRWNGEVRRTLEPLGAVLKGGTWYVVAAVGGQVRAYRVSSMLDVEPFNKPFERPPDFDLAGFWRAWAERFQAELYGGQAIRLSPRGQRLDAVLGPAAAQMTIPGASPDAGGWKTMILPIESIELAVSDLLRLGPDVEALEPPELRQRMAEAAAALAALYQPTRS